MSAVNVELLEPGEVVDCASGDDAEDSRRLMRALATYTDGHDLRVQYVSEHRLSHWYQVTDATCFGTGRKFKRESRTDEAGR